MFDIEIIKAYKPVNEQEESDKRLFLTLYDTYGDALFERHDVAHFTASCLILNKEHTKILLEYHNIYQTWSWVGGHNDGEQDFLALVIKEAKEETGLDVTPIFDYPIALDDLWVNGHIKRGKYVSTHLHLDMAYLVEAEENAQLIEKEDEVSGLKWFTIEEFKQMNLDIMPVYLKMLERLEI